MRDLSLVEVAIFERLFSADFDGVDALRAQVSAIRGVEPNCTCGCPSITPDIDRATAPPSHAASMLPVELHELDRTDGVAREVLCFLDVDGYIGNLECVYYDDPKDEWPNPANCSVDIRPSDR